MKFTWASPGSLSGVQIGLGIITVILSIYALTLPATFEFQIFLLAILLVIIGTEKIISGIYLPVKGRWAIIALSILVLIFAGLAISFLGEIIGGDFIDSVFVGIALIFNGFARIAEGISRRDSGWKTHFLIGVGIFSVILGAVAINSTIIGALLVALIVPIGTVITGIQMIAVGVSSRKMVPDSP